MMKSKPTKYAVAAIIYNEEKEVFMVKRPHDGPVPDIWGFPAVVLREGELPEEGIKRVGVEKLGCKIEPVRFIGAAVQERKDGFLHLFDYESKLIEGKPNVSKANTDRTKYVDQKWTSDYRDVREGAERGSLCEQLFLYHKGMWDKQLIEKVLDQRI